MARYKYPSILSAIIAVCLTLGAYAADQSPGTNVHKKKMKMDEPMTTGMMKKGMMKGDVKSASEKKDKDMQPMMNQEEKTMPKHTENP